MGKKLGQESAFGYSAHSDNNDEPGHGRTKNSHPQNLGMSKRLYIAIKAMQGLLANPDVVQYKHDHPRNDMAPIIAKAAYEFADELLKQEDGE